MSYEFTPEDYYTLKSAYTGKASTKTSKNKVEAMRVVNLIETQGKLVLVTEQHTFGQTTNGIPVDNPSHIALFVISDMKVESIINIPKVDIMTGGSKSACYAFASEEKLHVLTGTSDQGPMMVFTYDLETKKLINKPFKRDANDAKVFGDICYDVSSSAGNYYMGPLNNGFKGIKMTLIEF